MNPFIDTIALFRDDDPETDKIRELIGDDEQSNYTEDRYCFDLREIVAFNPSTFEGFINLKSANGFGINIKMSYEEMLNLVNKYYERK